MLVIDGRLHPWRGTSLKTRNGVGVRSDGKVIFAISPEAVSFDAFARLFRDGLKCPNAHLRWAAVPPLSRSEV
jgi:uncharacterized protein YigE (DUF2233 family)